MVTETLQRGRRTTQVVAAYRHEGEGVGEPRPPARSRLAKLVWATALLVLLGAGVYLRHQSTSAAAAQNAPTEAAVRQVTVIKPERATAREIVLPATVQAFQTTDLFARASGFLKAWHVDIGAAVKAGQLLAEIETPELDQELAQTRASLQQAEADLQQAKAELEEGRAELVLAEANALKAEALLEFSLSQARRYETLLSSRAVSREEYESVVRDRDARGAELASARADVARRKTNLDTRKAIIDNKAAIVLNRQANVQRLRELTGFQKVVAPFDSIVTRRSAEVGMLVTAGSNTGTRPLFSVAQIDVLRVHVAVPQSSALGIKAGDQAWVTIPEKPGQVLVAKVARTAGAVEPGSRSLLVEVELPNARGELLPGVYAQVRLQSPNTQESLVIPTQVLLMRSSGPHVILVSSDGTVRAQKLTLGRDFGQSVEVLAGLVGEERLVVNPSDDLRDGQMVQIANTADSHKQIAKN